MRAHAIALPQTTATTFGHHLLRPQRHHLSPRRPSLFPSPQGLEFRTYGESKASQYSVIRAVESVYESPWDEDERAYLDELDIVTFLDPPRELIPLDPASYRPAGYIWKKIEDIPEERRHRLLHLLKPRHISSAWEIAGTRYGDPKLAKRGECNLLGSEDGRTSLEFYNCRTSEGPMPIAWMNSFKTAIFSCDDRDMYGRFISGSFLDGLGKNLCPLYFVVRNIKQVMPTEQPCDYAYEFGDGLFDLHTCPEGFPRPAKHPYPFNDQVVVYVRQLGPCVAVGQAWQEGNAIEQVPRKLCSEILMVKDYASV